MSGDSMPRGVDAFCPGPQGVLSLVGAGGKTSLMFELAHQLARGGKRVLTTTTTKIFLPTAEQSSRVIIAADPGDVLQQLAAAQPTTGHLSAGAAQLTEHGKLQGFQPEAIDFFQRSGAFDWILVEADGAARRPLKAPAAHEPVIPTTTSVLVAVAGLKGLGKTLSEEQVFRSALATPLLGLNPGDRVDETALVGLLAHPAGAFKDAPPQVRRLIVLNQADSPQLRASAARIAAQLQQLSSPPAAALLVTQARPRLRVHAFYPLGIQQ